MPKVDRQTLKNKDKIVSDISAFTKNKIFYLKTKSLNHMKPMV